MNFKSTFMCITTTIQPILNRQLYNKLSGGRIKHIGEYKTSIIYYIKSILLNILFTIYIVRCFLLKY